MAILEADVKFRASQRMTDFADGGGLMSTVTIVDGVDNNLFDDITDLQRLFGNLSLRKVYGAALSNNSDTYISAHAIVDIPPTDSATGCFIFATGGLTTERASAVAALQGSVALLPIAYVTSGSLSTNVVSASWTGGGTSLVLSYVFAGDGGWNAVAAGQVLSVNLGGVRTLVQATAAGAASTALAGTRTITLTTTALPGAGAQTGTVQYPSSAGPRAYGVATSSAGAGAGTSIAVDSVWGRVVPVDLASAYPTDSPSWGISGVNLAATQGQVQIIAPSDAVLISSTIAMTPAAVSNASTTTTGRTNLSRLRVIGNSGVVHASFVLNQPAPSGVGCTADLTAGTVTFTDVSGYSQPVTVEHRIEEMSVVSSISGNTLTLNRALSRAYPAGTRVSSLLMLGDLKARVGVAFAQNAWTGVWSDSVLGGSPAADYDIAGTPFVVTNQGAVNERWYCQFTNTTTFTLVGEQLGVIGTFGIGSPCAPNNPATGVPYFTIPSVGWGSGWAAGNVFRFNTSGANAPIWVGRSVAPSASSGDDSVTLQLRGYVNT